MEANPDSINATPELVLALIWTARHQNINDLPMGPELSGLAGVVQDLTISVAQRSDSSR